MNTATPTMSWEGSKAFTDYLVDAGQRTVLFWDLMRQRGNHFLDYMENKGPKVLQFDAEVIVDGRTLPKPVNYFLYRILPPKDAVIDPRKRPFVVVDPRAGHGPGIGGFKADSEIGEALRAGHPCYFIVFTPVSEPGQTLGAITLAEAHFLERVIERHPDVDGRPVIIGNCQAGWAVMMLAATHPDLCGPIILAGSPLSYWAGKCGENPMRYTGGLLGGSWLTAMISDLGNGVFDGAWLVQNFENLNPANTLWSKQYNLYAKLDTEGQRYLDFERWWGGHVLMNGDEIQTIVDDLFVGNRLASSRMVTSEGIRIDLRDITTPIICFCSKGDNITPPQQALGWILDLYESVDDIRASGQTIIYAIHESVGHLGIFVSGSVVRKEHHEFSSNIDFIDCMPPGLYEAVLVKKTSDTENAELVEGDYISRFERRTLDDIRALGGNDVDEERCFATVARLSQTTLGLYRTMAQPIVKTVTTPKSAEWLRRVHPLRLTYETLSDRNPLMGSIAEAAEKVQQDRRPVGPENPFWQWQEVTSHWIAGSLDLYRFWRDTLCEQTFFGIYRQPWLQALLGLRASDGPSRQHPGQDLDHMRLVARELAELKAGIDKGGLEEAILRALIYIRIPEGASDERGFEAVRQMREAIGDHSPISAFKEMFRNQFHMLLIDEARAVEAIPGMLENHLEEAPKAFEHVRRIVTASGELGEEASRRLEEMANVFAAPKAKATAKPAVAKTKSAA